MTNYKYTPPEVTVVTKLNRADLLEMARQIGRDNAWDTYGTRIDPSNSNDALWAWEAYVWGSAATWLNDVRTPREIRDCGRRYDLDVTSDKASLKSVMAEVNRNYGQAWKEARRMALEEGDEYEAKLLKQMGWDGR